MERAKHKKNAFQKHWLMAKTHSNIFNEQRSQHNELKHKRIPKNGTDFEKHIQTHSKSKRASRTYENTKASNKNGIHLNNIYTRTQKKQRSEQNK